MKNIDYKYNEDALLKEFKEYIDQTYGEHYSQNKFQATEFIIDSGHGVGFCLGNVMKYAQRYGKKAGRNRQDLLKVLHYALFSLYVHDMETKKDTPKAVPLPDAQNDQSARFSYTMKGNIK